MAIVELAVDDHGVALVTIDDPARPHNVTSPVLVAELMAVLERVAKVPSIRGAVITSGKAGRFVAGGDILDFVGAHDRGMSEAEAFAISQRWNIDLRRIERCGKPIAAAINGAALGGGLELALCCQHRVLVDDPKAVVGLVEVGIGLIPAGGGSQRLPRLIGSDTALRLMIDGCRLAPAEALALGVVDDMAPARELVDRARAWVRANPEAQQPWDRASPPRLEDLGAMRRRWTQEVEQRFQGNYPAPPALLRAVFDGGALPIEQGLRIESLCSAALLTGVVARNLMRTGFVFRGRADKRARQVVPGAGLEAAALRLWPHGSAPRLAEVVPDAAANQRQIDQALARAAQQRCTPVVCARGRGSFVQRLWERHRTEARALAAAGVDEALLTAAARHAGLAFAPGGQALLPAAAPGRTEPIRMRLLCALALEGVRAFEDGQIGSADEADLASVLGAGYPPWTGGVLSFVDTIGAAAFVAQCDALRAAAGERFAVSDALRERARGGGRFHAAMN